MSVATSNNAAKTNIYTTYSSNAHSFNNKLLNNNPGVNIVFDKVEISAKAMETLRAAGRTPGGITEDESLPSNQKSLLEELLEAEENARNVLVEGIMPESAREIDEDNKGSGVQDPTRKLTRMLVAAKSINQVYNVLSEAFKHMGEIIQAAAYGDEKARNILRRLNKLIRRATRKVRDLNNEDQLRRKETRAREKEIEELARQIEMELKRKLLERKQREKKYLRDNDHDDDDCQEIPGTLSSGMPSDAQIKAMAWQAAQATIAAQSASSVSSGGDSGFSTGNNPGSEASLSCGHASGGDEETTPTE